MLQLWLRIPASHANGASFHALFVLQPVGKDVTDTADVVADAALVIGHCQVQPSSDEDTRARAQLELPMRHGGMGLHRLSPAEGPAAFLSSAVLTNVAMTGAPEQFRPFDGPAGAGLRQAAR